MDPASLASFLEELNQADDASSIENIVKVNFAYYLGQSNRIKIHENKKSNAIRMVQQVIVFLEALLCNETSMNVFEARFTCQRYMDALSVGNNKRRFKYLRTQWGLIKCLENWGFLDSVEQVGASVLEVIKDLSTKTNRGYGVRTLAKPGQDTSNHDVAYSVFVAATALIRVFWSRRSQEEGLGTIILDLVREMYPWFRFINQEDQINGMPIREWIFSFLSKCALSIVDERQHPNESIQFCEQIIKQFVEAPSMTHQMLEFGRAICHSLFSKKDDLYINNSQILFSVLETMAIQCKNQPGKEEILTIFMQLAGYYTIKYGEASADQCIKVARFFHNLAEKYFPKVLFPYAGLIMEQYAIALVLSDSDSYKSWPNTKLSNALSIREVLTKLELHLQESIHIHDKTYTKFPAFLCDRIATFILYRYEEMIPMDENSIDLPTIREFLDNSMELRVSANCEYESTEHTEQVAKLAVTLFLFLLITQQDTRGLFEKLAKDGKFHDGILTNLCQRLRKIYQTFSNSDKVDEAIETLKFCCEVSWLRVSLYCDMVRSSKYGVCSNCFSKDGIVYIVKVAAEDSASLLRIIHQHHTQDVVDNTFETYIHKWVLAHEKFNILSPAPLVTAWVTIQCQETQPKNHTGYLPPTICSLVASLRDSRQASCIIKVEEILSYRKMQKFDSEFFNGMKKHIQDSVPRISSEHIIDNFNFLRAGGMRLASLGHQGQLDCITYITEAVNMLLNCDKGDINLNELLPEAYFQLSLIKRLAYPMRKDYTEDIRSGLKLYGEKNLKLNETKCTLLYCIMDLLSIEGNMELQREVCEIMIKSRGEEFIGIALKSGNLHHALCSSPVNDTFLDMVHGNSYWRTCATFESLEAGTYQSLSMLPTLSYLKLDDATLKAQETIEKVKHSLITNVSDPKNLFADAHGYYNLAEIMIAKGLTTKALPCANESYRLRNKLLTECFTIEWGVETVETNKKVCKTFYPDPSRLSSAGDVPTPLNLLRCYLESALQNGTLHHMIGNSSEAADILYCGKELASIQNFPVFLVGFSIALGNLHCDEKDWNSATKELNSARNLMNVCQDKLCKKCILVLQVKLDQLEGDIHLSILKNKGNNSDALRKAKDLYKRAKSNLENEEWVNSVSRPEKETSKENNLFLCYSTEKSNEDCWHCQTSIIEKSFSLEDLTNFKLEVIRRRYLLKVLIKLAKCYKLQGDVTEERRSLMEGICALVGRSTFQKLEWSSSFVEELVKKNVVAQALGAEQASLLHMICRFSLRHERESETAILSRENVVLGLKMAFVLSREVPKVHEQVSQTLAVIYACSSTVSTLSKSQRESEIRSASYFHQCSIGSHFNSRFLSQEKNQMEVDGSPNLVRVLAPSSIEELEESISAFCNILPRLSVTYLCISMFSIKSYRMLDKFLPEGSSNFGWLMISRFHTKIGPIVLIFPISETLKVFRYQKDTSISEWRCPWAGNIFDQVAPVLRLVLEEDIKLDPTQQNTNKMVEKMKKLDKILGDFLRDLEDLWLGAWKFLLLGECSGSNDPEKKDDDVDNITDEMEQQCFEQLKSNYGCYIGTSGGNINKTRKKKPGGTNKKKCRNPIIIVSQLKIQMIPFESIPVLQEQQIYRMPSVGSILRSHNRKRVVNPCKCYYLIQDHEHFAKIIKCVEEWSNTFPVEGIAPIAEKVRVDDFQKALDSHDLFLWGGHEHGEDYIPINGIQEIRSCCAAILMGCSTGYLYSRNHAMEAALLEYLLRGSPVVIANLWSVNTTGINSFTLKLFEMWTEATSAELVECKGTSRKRKPTTGMFLCEHEFDLGSGMTKARDACTRRYLDGAAGVIYGMPTRIASNL